jgi:nucleoside 2-deoxyribosyltransferase
MARAKPALEPSDSDARLPLRRTLAVYLAGPLFSEGERAFNLDLARRIEKLGYRVFLPQRDVPPARGRGRTRRLFEGCLGGLRSADLVVAVCDGSMADDGTAWECGYAVGTGKAVYALRTDFRRVAADEHLNLMIQEGVTAFFPTVPRLLGALERRARRASGKRRGGTRRHLTRP